MKLATIKEIRRDGAARRRPHHDRARSRSAVSRRAHSGSGRASSSICRRRASRRRSSTRRCASTATTTSFARSASAAIRTTRRAWFSTRPASRATACIPLYDPYRLVIDCVREPDPTSTSAAPPAPVGSKDPPLPVASKVAPAAVGTIFRPFRTLWLWRPRTRLSLSGTVFRPSRPAEPCRTRRRRRCRRRARPQTALPALTSTSAPPKNVGGGYSLARQLGLSVSRIVIDPGHGGHDPGAKGKSITEAELVLDVALRLEKLLQKVPGIEVMLTRRTDEFVSLQERTAIANREGADLFLSIHANASANSAARGVETYFLNFASNMTAAAVAARENAASGQSMGALPDFVKAIALNNKLDESRDFATRRAARDGRAPSEVEQDREGPRRQAGAVRRADWRGDAERAGGDLVRDERAGSEAACAATPIGSGLPRRSRARSGSIRRRSRTCRRSRTNESGNRVIG